MLPTIPMYISIIFGLTTLLTIYLFYRATNHSKLSLVLIIGWTMLVSIIALVSDFFQLMGVAPPRIAYGVTPTIIVILVLFLTTRGRAFIDSIDLEKLTYMHTIRIPVEIVLALLAHQGVISYLQTFEGANFDILSGITAPLMAYLYFKKGTLSRNGLLIWNIICLILVLTIVIISILAIPSPFQQIAFDQPNIGISYFPFNLLPMVVVPLVVFGHLVAIRRL